MKKILALLLAVCVVMGCAGAEEADDIEYRFNDYGTPQDYEVSKEDLLTAAVHDFPEWDVVDCSQYWTGLWEDQRAFWTEINLMRVENSTLYQRNLCVLVNPLKQGEPVPWEITDMPPLPMTEETVGTLLAMDPEWLYSDGTYLVSCQLNPAILPGCALFLLEEGEAWLQLFSYTEYLTGIVENAKGQTCVRIAHWDGGMFDEVISSPFCDEEISINSYATGGSTVTVRAHACDPVYVRQPDGRWLFVGIADGNWTLYRVEEDYITDAIFWACQDSNDVLHYGMPTFERDLTKADLNSFPDFIRDVIPQLDSSSYACVKVDGTPMMDSPGGETLAVCYARLAGKILQQQEGYAQLRIGSAEKGMTGWFAEADLAFGPETEGVRCGFPSHSEDDCTGEYLVQVLTGVDSAELTESEYLVECMVWLIGQLPDGGWLVQLDVDTVCTAPADAFRDVGPARELWADFEAEYDECEQEMLEWASEEGMEREEDE